MEMDRLYINDKHRKFLQWIVDNHTDNEPIQVMSRVRNVLVEGGYEPDSFRQRTFNALRNKYTRT